MADTAHVTFKLDETIEASVEILRPADRRCAHTLAWAPMQPGRVACISCKGVWMIRLEVTAWQLAMGEEEPPRA